jgi:Cd(II)/Pb(II)-responsive transcriptional regulator
MKIGELAKSANCKVETIRYYEKMGLMSAPSRTEGGYRTYEKQHGRRLHFIRHCRALGMPLEEIRTLAFLCDHPETDCGVANKLIETQLDRIKEQIASLQQLEKSLRGIRKACSLEGPARECGILRGLSKCSLNPSCEKNHQLSSKKEGQTAKKAPPAIAP